MACLLGIEMTINENKEDNSLFCFPDKGCDMSIL